MPFDPVTFLQKNLYKEINFKFKKFTILIILE